MHAYIHHLTVIFQYLNHIPDGAWQALLATVVVSPAVNAIKKWRGWKNERWILVGTTFICFLIAAGNYLMHTPSQDPEVIALQTAVISFFATHVYTLLVKPLWSALAAKFNVASDLNQQLHSAAVPAEGLPLHGEPVSPTAAQAQQDELIAEMS